MKSDWEVAGAVCRGNTLREKLSPPPLGRREMSAERAWVVEFYVPKIQPQLRTLKVREIAQTMQVSQPYAASIRSCRRRHHPRHWEALAKLTKMSLNLQSLPKQSN